MASAKKIDEFAATGRRKTSVTRVRLVKGAGTITVNGLDVKEYFDTKDMIDTVSRPLVVTDREGQYDLKISVKGGGKVGQSGAISHGLSRALVIAEEDLKIRGPGEFLGTRQSGVPQFRMADIFRDREMVALAKSDAKQVIRDGRLDFLDRAEWEKRFGRSLV